MRGILVSPMSDCPFATNQSHYPITRLLCSSVQPKIGPEPTQTSPNTTIRTHCHWSPSFMSMLVPRLLANETDDIIMFYYVLCFITPQLQQDSSIHNIKTSVFCQYAVTLSLLIHD